MKLRITFLYSGLIICLSLFLILSGASGTAEANTPPLNKYLTSSDLDINSGLISAPEDTISSNSVPEPWSIARMEAAQPYPTPNIQSLPTTRNSWEQPSGEPVFIPGIPPADGAQDTPAADPTSIQAIQSIAGYDYPAPYTRYENFDDYTLYPYSTIGVLFFTQRGADYRCSAAVVGENAVWTAGHCLHDGSGEPEGASVNVVFVPAYKNGSAPFDLWYAEDSNLKTLPEWENNRDLRFDFGGAILNPNSTDKTIQEVVGSLGFAYNLNPNQHWFNFGYPTADPFNGTTMQICAGSFARNTASYGFPYPMGMGCDLTPGSSGGPWIINFSGSTGNTNYLNGNNSFRFTGYYEEINSPYFGEGAKDLLDMISSNTRLRTNIHIPIVSSFGDK
ncbi:MAG: serine protease [Anaerolineales bacterium]